MMILVIGRPISPIVACGQVLPGTTCHSQVELMPGRTCGALALTTPLPSSAAINETSAAAGADILQIVAVPVWVVAVFVEPNWLQICWPQQSNEFMCMAGPNHCTFLRS